MREDIYDGIKKHIQIISGFDKIEIVSIEAGHCELEVDVEETMINLYGTRGSIVYPLRYSLGNSCLCI